MNRKLEVLGGVALFLLCIVGQCIAQPPVEKKNADKWQQSITTYFWLPAQHGDAIIRGRPVDVDTSISDAWDALSSLEGAAVVHYEARKNLSSIIADLFYIKLGDSIGTPLGDADFESRQTIAEFALAREVSRKMVNGREQTIEALIGGRYNELGLELDGPLGFVEVDKTQSWVDPFIGARFTKKLSPEWVFSTRGDIGGFGIGDASDFTWNLMFVFQYRMSNLWGFDFGWRFLDYDYDTGSGTSEFKYDVLMQGPFVGFTYNW